MEKVQKENVQSLSPSSFDAVCSVHTQTRNCSHQGSHFFVVSSPCDSKRSVRLDVAFRVFAMAIRYRHVLQ